MLQKKIFKNCLISIVVPVYNESGNIAILVDSIATILNNRYEYEIVFVDDGSHDDSLYVLKKINKENKKVKFISFTRNFGHQNALRAGLDIAEGNCVITMDGDMQHPPKLIPTLIKKWEQGNDIVNTVRKENSNTSLFKKRTAATFYFIMNKLSEVEIKKGTADFRLLDKKVVETLKTINESDLFIRGIIPWLGYKQYEVEYMPGERTWGKTKYSVSKMIRFALAGITGFSVKPLHISTYIGFFLATFAFFYGFYAICVKYFTPDVVSGWTSVLVAVLFIGGVQLIIIGIYGEYLGRLFMESKKRPKYIIKEKSDD